MWAEKNNRAIKFFTARPNGVLRALLRSINDFCYDTKV